MNDTNETDIREQKKHFRARAESARRALADKPDRSASIVERVRSLRAYRKSKTVMWYLGLPHEVHTWNAVAEELRGDRRVVIPYCQKEGLGLFRLETMDEVGETPQGLFEPLPELRQHPGKTVEAGELEAVVIPGVAFDRRGGRVGHGARYYDRLLAERSPHAALLGVCYECQLFDAVPMLAHDAFMHRVITERASYEASGEGA